MIDGNWETLCLPFTVNDWSKSFDVQELIKITQNGAKLDLGFDKAQKIQANQPVILRGKANLSYRLAKVSLSRKRQKESLKAITTAKTLTKPICSATTEILL